MITGGQYLTFILASICVSILLQTNQCRQVANKATGKHEKLNDLNGELQEVQDDLKEQKQQEVKRKRK